ncbi:SET and MYND domain-containing protein (SMYD)-like protein, partial [Leptotrombidium deliense]
AILTIDYLTNYDTFQHLLLKRAELLFDFQEYDAAMLDIEDLISLNRNSHKDNSEKLLALKSKYLRKIEEKNAKRVTELRNKKRREKRNDVIFENELFTDESNFLDEPLLNENELLPGASSKLEMAFVADKGRVIKAKTDISKSSVLVSEAAFLSWLRPCRYNRYCFFCLRKLGVRFFPCRQCKTVRFCSFTCETKAWTEHHQVECKFLPQLKRISFGHAAVRVLVTHGIDNVLTMENETKENFAQFPMKQFPSNYRSFSSLVVHSKNLIFEYLFAYCCGATILTILLEKMNLVERNSNCCLDIATVLVKLMCRINLNCYLIRDFKYQKCRTINMILHNSRGPKIGIAIYLSASLISHSCDYNSVRFSNGSAMLLVSEKNIEKGEEVTVTYTPHYRGMCFLDRQNFLSDGYYFKCRCVACEQKWENVEQALKCEFCNGPVIWSEYKNHSNYCLRCNKQNKNVSQCLEIVNKTEEQFNVIWKLMAENNYKDAIGELMAIRKVYSSLFHSDTKLLNVKEQLSVCHRNNNNFNTAFKLLDETVSVRELRGDQNLEMVFSLIYTIFLLKCDMKGWLNRFNIRKHRRLRQLRKLVIRTLKTYQESNLLLLDAPFVYSYENFIQQLQKYSKRYTLLPNFIKV